MGNNDNDYSGYYLLSGGCSKWTVRVLAGGIPTGVSTLFLKGLDSNTVGFQSRGVSVAAPHLCRCSLVKSAIRNM